MAQVCEYCAKRRQHGNTVSHSKRRSRTTFKVNLHSRRVMDHGVGKTVKLCTNCINLLKKRMLNGESVPFQLQFHRPQVEA